MYSVISVIVDSLFIESHGLSPNVTTLSEKDDECHDVLSVITTLKDTHGHF